MTDFIFTADKEEALASEASGNGGAFSTGLYKVTDVVASLGKTGKGNNIVDLAFKVGNQKGIIYMAFCTDKKWASGAENFGYGLWQQFIAVTGMKTGETGTYTPKKDDGSNVQKDGKDVVLTVFKEVHGKPLTLALQKSLDVYNGDIKESNVIHSIYSAEGKAYSEMVGNLPAEKATKVAERLKDKESKAYKAYGTGSVAQEEESTGSLLD